MDVGDKPLRELGTTVLFTVGHTHVTLAAVVFAAVVVLAALIASRLAVALLARLRTRFASGAAALYMLEKFASYGISLFGVVFALSSLGIDFSTLALFAGAIGVGAGLGLQGVVKEFVSGIVLLFDHIVNVGDYVELPGDDGVRGIVYEIGARAIRIRTNDNVDIFVPNSRLIEERVINWTLQGQTRRLHIPFSVAYGVDKAKVRDVVLAAARSVDMTMPDTATRRTQVWLTSFGDSALNFELVVWPILEAVKRPAAAHAAYTWAIDDALRAAGIEIPFPQRDLRLRSAFGREGEEAFRALGFGTLHPVAPAASAGVPSQNDAVQDVHRPEETPPPAHPKK